MAVEAAGVAVPRFLRTMAATITAIRITRLRSSGLLGVTATPRTIATITNTLAALAPIFTATCMPPFVVFGVCEPIGLQPPPHQRRRQPELHLRPRRGSR